MTLYLIYDIIMQQLHFKHCCGQLRGVRKDWANCSYVLYKPWTLVIYLFTNVYVEYEYSPIELDKIKDIQVSRERDFETLCLSSTTEASELAVKGTIMTRSPRCRSVLWNNQTQTQAAVLCKRGSTPFIRQTITLLVFNSSHSRDNCEGFNCSVSVRCNAITFTRDNDAFTSSHGFDCLFHLPSWARGAADTVVDICNINCSYGTFTSLPMQIIM